MQRKNEKENSNKEKYQMAVKMRIATKEKLNFSEDFSDERNFVRIQEEAESA
jgi:hypothetical protein